MTSKEKFCVLLSLYFKEKPEYLNSCLNSIYIQTLPADQVVIVYDGDLPLTLSSIVDFWKDKLPIKTISLSENVGLGRALNIGLSYCTSSIVLRMDTDDICTPERFEKQVTFLSDNVDYGICGSCIEEIDGNMETIKGSRMVPESDSEIRIALPYYNPFNHMTVAFRKEYVLEVGNYQHLHFMEDWYLWMRLLSLNIKAYNFQEKLVKVRVGHEMLARRSGIKYIASEWKISKYKVELKLISWPKAFFIFLLRAAPRVLPIFLLAPIYRLSRIIYIHLRK